MASVTVKGTPKNHMSWPGSTTHVPERCNVAGGTVAAQVWMTLASVLLLLGIGLLGLRLVGYQFISVRGNSMTPTFSSGSLLLARSAAPDDIRAGDIIAFPGASAGDSAIVHRVIVLQNVGRHLVASTMGDSNPVPDPDPVTLKGPVPRVVWIAPHAGWWLTPDLGWQLMAISGFLTLLVTIRYTAPTGFGTKASDAPLLAQSGRCASLSAH